MMVKNINSKTSCYGSLSGFTYYEWYDLEHLRKAVKVVVVCIERLLMLINSFI